MNVALLTHFYPPEPCAAANRAQALVRALLAEGHKVTVITNFPSFPQGSLAAPDRRCLIRREHIDGADVVRLLTLHFRPLPGARLAHWLSSSAAFLTYLLIARPRFDCIAVTVPPITLAAPALAAARRHRATLVLDVRDVFPDVAVAMGAWKPGGLLERATHAVADRLYRRAAIIGTVTPTGVRQIAARGVDAERLVLTPNGCDAIDLPARARSFSGGLHAVFTGNLGLAADTGVLVDAAELLRDDPRISITIVGDGAEGQKIRERIVRADLHNITMAGVLPRAQTLQVLADADVSIVPLRKGIADSLPTKIFDALAVGCPVIVCAHGEAAAIATQSGGGVAIPPGDGAALAEELKRFADLRETERRSLGERGRTFVESRYRRDVIMSSFCRRLALVEQRVS